MADFYVNSTVDFVVPHDRSFPASPSEVIIKANFTPPIAHPGAKQIIDHPGAGAEIMHPSTEYRFVKTMTQSPVIHVTR